MITLASEVVLQAWHLLIPDVTIHILQHRTFFQLGTHHTHLTTALTPRTFFQLGTCMPAIVEKDNWLIWHCCASKYKNGPVVGMRVPLYK